MKAWLRMTRDPIPHVHVPRAFRFLIPALSLAVASADEARGQAEHDDPCTLSDADTQWIQDGFDGWERVSVDVLKLHPRPLPWMVLFNQMCAWHVAPDTSRLLDAKAAGVRLTFGEDDVSVSARPHDRDLWIPSGSTRPIEAMAFASAYGRDFGERAPFFVLALPDVWLEGADVEPGSDPHKELLGVAIHELVHTLQVTELLRRLEEMGARYTLPDGVSDETVQERFTNVPGFRDAHEAETDLLYRAVSESDRVRKRALVNDALHLIRRRQATYFTGADVVYKELEELFLNMEGVAEWARYRFARLDAPSEFSSEDPSAHRERETWAQDQGLALFLLIDDLVPHWRERVLGPELASPYELLEAAVGQP